MSEPTDAQLAAYVREACAAAGIPVSVEGLIRHHVKAATANERRGWGFPVIAPHVYEPPGPNAPHDYCNACLNSKTNPRANHVPPALPSESAAEPVVVAEAEATAVSGVAPPFLDPVMKSVAEKTSDLWFDLEEPPMGWTGEEGASYDFPKDAHLLSVFAVATKHLQSTDFGKRILEEWRDERSDYKAQDPSYSMKDFMDDLGYLEGFTGRNLSQLLKYYLSPKAIVDGAWLHADTWRSEDGRLIAYTFVPLSFREYDAFMWVQEVSSGKGWAVEYNQV